MMRGATLTAALLLAGTAIADGPTVPVCWDYGCDVRRNVTLSDTEWQRVRGLFANPAADAAAERARIARAIALFERFVGARTGTEADLAKNFAGSGQPYQMDCIDESRNTDTYLRLLARHGLLLWHDVMERERRAPYIFYPHWTAVIRDRGSDRLWAVDSWWLDNGMQPYIQHLDAWRRNAELPSNPDAP